MKKIELILVVCTTFPAFSFAQSSIDPKKKNANRMLEEVVVTAQKREQNLQDVPISISAFSAEKLDAMGIGEVRQLDKITPGLTFTESFGYTVVYLRGVGTNAFLPSADPTVPFYVDGINLLPGQGAKNTLGKIQRVEVLKGPQGTLFGRNALGGAISIVTAEPNPAEFAFDAKLETGRYNKKGADFFVNIPLTDNLAATLVGFDFTNDSHYEYTSDLKMREEYQKGWRARVRWDISDSFYADASASYQDGGAVGALVGENTEPTPLFSAIIPADPKADRKVDHNLAAGSAADSILYSLVLGWNISLFDTKLILAEQELNTNFGQLDFDASPLPLASFDGGGETENVRQFAEQYTAEIQFLSNESSPYADWLEWVAGVYYLKSEAGLDPVLLQVGKGIFGNTALSTVGGLLDTVLSPIGIDIVSDGVTLFTKGILETESKSIYAQATVDLSSQLALTAGLRYDEESRILVEGQLGARAPILGDTVVQRYTVPEANTNRYSPKVALNWWVSENITVYSSYSVGFLSPTYNTANFFSAPDLVEQEKSVAYELGMKGTLLDGAMKFDTAVFYTELTDIIGGFFGLTSGGVVRFDNTGDGEIKGFEFNLQWQAMPALNPGLVITANGSFLDAEYANYPDGKGFNEETGLAFGPGSITGAPGQDFSGNEIVNTPKLSYTLGISQNINFDQDNSIELAVDTYFNSGYYFSEQNSSRVEQPEYQLFNARLSYFYNPWGLQVSIFGRNLTDEDYFLQVIQQEFGRTQTLATPATYGASLAISY